MALIYSYSDTYITNSASADDIQNAEDDALIDLGKQGVTDTFYLEKMCKCLVYISLGTEQLEAEGMKDRIEQYRKDYTRYQNMTNFDGTDEGVHSIEIGRS